MLCNAVGIFGSHVFQLLPYWMQDLMCKPDPAHTFANETKSAIDSFTGWLYFILCYDHRIAIVHLPLDHPQAKLTKI